MRLTRQTRLRASSLAVLLVALGFQTSVHAQNWSRFRGNNGTGISDQKGIPTTWSPGAYSWNKELPGIGHAAPIIWEDSLFITTAVDKGAIRYLICLDAATGEQNWSRQIGMNRSRKHNKSSWASSTPVTDGTHVYVTFADKEIYMVAAYDFNGELAWRRSMGPFESQHGLGVSPILFDNILIIQNDQDGPSSIVALDKNTGQTLWSNLRPFRRTSYATPIIVNVPGEDPQLICVSGATGVTSFDPYTGKKNWNAGEFPLRTVASPVYAGGLILASCGQGGRYGVLQIAVDPSAKLAADKPRIRWQRKREIPYVPTPIVHGGYVFQWNDRGIVTCIDPKTGTDVWTKRVGGNYSGSPICIDGKIYCISEDGEVVVVGALPTFKLFGKTSLNDPSHSTPAVANGRFYLRTFHRLACLEAAR